MTTMLKDMNCLDGCLRSECLLVIFLVLLIKLFLITVRYEHTRLEAPVVINVLLNVINAEKVSFIEISVHKPLHRHCVCVIYKVRMDVCVCD